MLHIDQYTTRECSGGVCVDKIRNITVRICEKEASVGAVLYVSTDALEDIARALSKAADETGCGAQSEAWIKLSHEIQTFLKEN